MMGWEKVRVKLVVRERGWFGDGVMEISLGVVALNDVLRRNKMKVMRRREPIKIRWGLVLSRCLNCGHMV